MNLMEILVKQYLIFLIEDGLQEFGVLNKIKT